jgi:hypothetical protein
MDLHSRRIIGWALRETATLKDELETLDEPIRDPEQLLNDLCSWIEVISTGKDVILPSDISFNSP